MSALALFQFEAVSVRVVCDAAGEPWFVAADVCRVLDIANARDAVSGLDGDDVATTDIIDSLGRKQTANTVNESGLYQLIFASRKDEAKAFKRWITKEVIPAIRKTGGYSMSQALPKTFAESLRMLADAEERKAVLEIENAEMKPKAEFFDAVTAAITEIPLADAAKLLGTGQKRMMKAMRELSILRGNNTPYQRYVDAGYFRVIVCPYQRSDGSEHVSLTTRVLPKGLDFLRIKLFQN